MTRSKGHEVSFRFGGWLCFVDRGVGGLKIGADTGFALSEFRFWLILLPFLVPERTILCDPAAGSLAHVFDIPGDSEAHGRTDGGQGAVVMDPAVAAGENFKPGGSD
jgi:hypothetical protein